MPQKTLATMAASGRQASRIGFKRFTPIPRPVIPVPEIRKNKKIVILSLNDTYYAEGFGLWGQKTLDIMNTNNLDTTFVKVLVGDYLFTNKNSAILSGHDMILASNACKFDIGCLGNHEFDGGEEVLKELMTMSSFPLVCSNVSLETAKKMNFYTNYSFVKDDIKFGVIGYVTPETSILSVGAKNITFYELDYVFDTYKLFLLKNDVRIMLFHDNINIIVEYLEKNPEKKYLIDVICCGHEHVFYTGYSSRKDFNIPIVQMVDSLGVGYIELNFDTLTKKCIDSSANVLKIDSKQTQMQEIVILNKWISSITGPIFKQIIGKVIGFAFNGLSSYIRNNESNIGNFVADAFLYTGTTTLTNVSANNICSIVNSGSIRNNNILSINTDISVETIYSIMPFSNLLVGIEVIGRTSMNNLLNYIANISLSKKNSGAWLQISKNMEFNYKTQTYIFKSDNYSETDKFYCILIEYLANGNDGYTELKNYKKIKLDIPSQNSLVTYIQSMNGNISYPNTNTRIFLP
jgi:2',3'-cyclic-nucleotide 2'-phosphodiesterase (5'-nucleotidase family)